MASASRKSIVTYQIGLFFLSQKIRSMLFVTPELKQKTSRGECSVYYRILKLGGNISFWGSRCIDFWHNDAWIKCFLKP